MKQKKALIVDDDLTLQKLVKEFLESFGFTVITLATGEGAVELIGQETPDIVILDIMLPGKDGVEVLKEIRAKYQIPVIMLTARGEDTDRILGLELGADDYMPKPFNPRELLARIKAIFRRVETIEETAITKQDTHQLNAAGLGLDKGKQLLRYGKKTEELSSTEYKLLEAMMERTNIILSRDRLMGLVHDRDYMAYDRSIDVHISKLRAKIEKISGQKNIIRTFWGSGYMFVDEK